MKLSSLVTITAVLGGCTHQRKLNDPSALVYEHVTVEMRSAPGLVEDGRVIGTSGGYLVATDRGEIPFGDVKSITTTSHPIGALEGLGLGFLGGAAVGAVIGLADGDDVCDTSRGSDFCVAVFTAGEKAILLGVVFGALGGLVGLAVGADPSRHARSGSCSTNTMENFDPLIRSLPHESRCGPIGFHRRSNRAGDAKPRIARERHETNCESSTRIAKSAVKRKVRPTIFLVTDVFA